MRGLRQVVLPLDSAGRGARRYTVRLYFLEPDRLPAGRRRLFDVAVQGKPVIERLDVAGEAGGPRRLLVREIKGALAGQTLTVTLTPAPESAIAEPVLSGVEVVAEGW
jgi:hypothetical protein